MLVTFQEGSAWLDEFERDLTELPTNRLLSQVGMVLTSPSPEEEDRIGTAEEHAQYVRRLKELLARRRAAIRTELDKDIRRKGKRAHLTPLGRKDLAWYLAK